MKKKYKLELKTDYSVDQALLDNNFKIIILTFFPNLKNFPFNYKSLYYSLTKKERYDVQIYSIDSIKLREFNLMYEIKNSSSLVFFCNNRKIHIDSESGDTTKIVKLYSVFKKFKKICNLLIKNCIKGKNYLKTKIE